MGAGAGGAAVGAVAAAAAAAGAAEGGRHEVVGLGMVLGVGGTSLVDIAAAAVVVVAVAARKRVLVMIGCLKGLVLGVSQPLALGAGLATGHLLDVILRKGGS